MGVMRRALLAASENRWLRQQAPRMGFVKKAVRRFMPGERVEDALAAAVALRAQGVTAVVTKLGENVTDIGEADAVAAHYHDALEQIAAQALDCQVSVKLTQLGLDVNRERCLEHLQMLAARARTHGSMLWIDMEQHTYVDVTLELYRRVLAQSPNVGVCLQAYLYRTAADLGGTDPARRRCPPGQGRLSRAGVRRSPEEVRRRRQLRRARQVHAGAGGTCSGVSGRVRHARPGHHPDHSVVRGVGWRVARGVRVRAALRDSARRANTPGPGARADSGPRRVWRLLVSVVHAETRRATGKHPVRRQVDAVQLTGVSGRP